MAKAVDGFMSEDGVFYPTLEEAELHDARLQIQEGCRLFEKPVSSVRYIQTLEALAEQSWEYLSAYKKINGQEVHTSTEDTSELSGDTSDD